MYFFLFIFILLFVFQFVFFVTKKNNDYVTVYTLDSGTLRKLYDKIRAQRDDWIRRSSAGHDIDLPNRDLDARRRNTLAADDTESLSEGPITIESPLSEGPITESNYSMGSVKSVEGERVGERRGCGKPLRKQVNFEDEKLQDGGDDLGEQSRAIE